MIGPDANINGPIKLEQGIIIYGKVYGDISTRGSIRIAKSGIVNGNIKCSSIILGGTITGDIQSEGSVTLKRTSELKGDISYRKLHIEDGARFEGQCDLILDSGAENMLKQSNTNAEKL